MAEEQSKPIRGPLSLTVSAATPNIVAGTDFSIFVVAQNPYDVPVTLYQIQTHIPVELLDLNQLLLQRSLHENQSGAAVPSPSGWARVRRRLDGWRGRRGSPQTGFATAVGTDYAPGEAREFLRSQVNVLRTFTRVARPSG
ncbi:MAG: hypothetical protein QOE51_2683 [Actinoplanes sp.]|jgi:hypothetical protein|nr:hypothetical protein [Actinoplanes sp.]